jgi:homoserine dehydrogenase
MSRGSIKWSSTEITGTLTGRGSGSGNSVTLGVMTSDMVSSVSTGPTES